MHKPEYDITPRSRLPLPIWRFGARAGIGASLSVAVALTLPARAQPALPGGDGPFLGTGPDIPKTAPALPGSDTNIVPFGGADAPLGVPGAGWHLTPSLGIRLWGTDNARGTVSSNHDGGDLIIDISPSLQLTTNTARVAGSLNYSPTAQFYARSSNQNGINHNFNGQMLTTLVENTLFVDLRGFGNVTPAGGGFNVRNNAFALQNQVPIGQKSQIQTISMQASPYLVHHFGTFGTAQVGYTYTYINQSGNQAFLPGSNQPFFTSEETSGHEGYAVFRTGEEFGRVAFEGHALATVYESNGVLNNGHNYTATLEASYAITRHIKVLAEAGYEDQRYGGTQPQHIHDAIWTAGVRLDPIPGSVIIVRYGHRNGFNSAFVDAGVDIGVRTRLFVNYSDQLGTTALLGTDLLANTSLDPYGNPVHSVTGSPIIAPFGGGLLATQSSLSRIKRGTLGISQTWPRDIVTLFLYYDDIRPVTSTPGTTAFPQKGISGGLTWSHHLDPETVLTTSLQYGQTQSDQAGSGNIYTEIVALTHNFSPSLVGSLEYIFNRDSSGIQGNRAAQNIVLATLRKTF